MTMKDENYLIIISSAYGPLALTLDELRVAQSLGSNVAPAGVGPDRSSGETCDESPRLVDADEIAALLGIKPSWLLQRARERRLPHYRIGKYIRFDPAEIRAMTHKNPDRHAD